MAKLDEMLTLMVEKGASDLHLSAGEQLRMRVNGELRRITDKPLTVVFLSALMREICRDEQWDKFVSTKELDFAYGVKGVSRFRCNYLYQSRGPGAVFRTIPEKILPLDKLEFPEAVNKIPAIRSGLVLVTGPTGSGKSTTLAAIIDHINRNVSRHIITIEDPIEFVHQSNKSFIVQREVGAHSNTFSEALRDALLQDPDVILVGEMRDLETISLAVTAAEMGVLVLGTLHTNSAAKTLDRIIDSFPTVQKDQIRGMLAESLQAIVAQQLLKRQDRMGRIASVEIMLHGSALPNIIREGSASKLVSFIEAGRGRGMQTMDESLQKLVEQGIVSPNDAFLKCSNKNRFEEWLATFDPSAGKLEG